MARIVEVVADRVAFLGDEPAEALADLGHPDQILVGEIAARGHVGLRPADQMIIEGVKPEFVDRRVARLGAGWSRARHVDGIGPDRSNVDASGAGAMQPQHAE